MVSVGFMKDVDDMVDLIHLILHSQVLCANATKIALAQMQCWCGTRCYCGHFKICEYVYSLLSWILRKNISLFLINK